ncbi:Hypothetical protein D9617_40g012760 [Elsinoe fawcettii]|nr:Hypothetical protein D9617_40g012760 [Elsinoe fawcettii]
MRFFKALPLGVLASGVAADGPTQDTQEVYDGQTASFRPQGLCRYYDGTKLNFLGRDPQCDEYCTGPNPNVCWPIGGFQPSPSSIKGIDPQGKKYIVASCNCDTRDVVDATEQFGEILVEGIAAVGNVICDDIMPAVNIFIEAALTVVPGGPALKGLTTAVRIAKTVVENAHDAADMMSWFSGACGKPPDLKNFKPQDLLSGLSAQPDDLGRSLGCARRDKSKCVKSDKDDKDDKDGKDKDKDGKDIPKDKVDPATRRPLDEMSPADKYNSDWDPKNTPPGQRPDKSGAPSRNGDPTTLASNPATKSMPATKTDAAGTTTADPTASATATSDANCKRDTAPPPADQLVSASKDEIDVCAQSDNLIKELCLASDDDAILSVDGPDLIKRMTRSLWKRSGSRRVKVALPGGDLNMNSVPYDEAPILVPKLLGNQVPGLQQAFKYSSSKLLEVDLKPAPLKGLTPTDFATEHILEIQTIKAFIAFATTGSIDSVTEAADPFRNRASKASGKNKKGDDIMTPGFFKGFWDQANPDKPWERIYELLGSKTHTEHFLILDKVVNNAKALIWGLKNTMDPKRFAVAVKDSANPDKYKRTTNGGKPSDLIAKWLTPFRKAVGVYQYLNHKETKQRMFASLDDITTELIKIEQAGGAPAKGLTNWWNEFIDTYLAAMQKKNSDWYNESLKIARREFEATEKRYKDACKTKGKKPDIPDFVKFGLKAIKQYEDFAPKLTIPRDRNTPDVDLKMVEAPDADTMATVVGAIGDAVSKNPPTRREVFVA